MVKGITKAYEKAMPATKRETDGRSSLRKAVFALLLIAGDINAETSLAIMGSDPRMPIRIET